MKKDAALGSLTLQAPTTLHSKAPAVTHQPWPAKDSNNDNILFFLSEKLGTGVMNCILMALIYGMQTSLGFFNLQNHVS